MPQTLWIQLCRLVRVLLTLLLFWGVSSCGVNLYKGFSSEDSDRYRLTEAKNHIDKKEYEQAEEILAEVENPGLEKTFLQVSATLGKAGLSLWDILLDAVESAEASASSNRSGAEKVFDLFSDTFFGQGDERQQRLQALDDSVRLLNDAASPGDKADQLRCFLLGIYLLPTINDGAAAISAIGSSLDQIAATVSGNGATPEECSGLSSFQTALNDLIKVQAGFSLVLEQISACPLIDFLGDTSELSALAERARTVTETADQGCPQLSCSGAFCDALGLPCVSQLLDTQGVVAGDQKVDACELIYNCKDGGCF